MKKIPVFTLAIFLIGTISFAQDLENPINDFIQATNADITLSKSLEVPEFIKFPHENPLVLEGATAYDKSMSFLERYKSVFDIKSVETSFQLETTKTDNYGFKHVTLLQIHEGVPIFDGQLKFHFNQEKQTLIHKRQLCSEY